MKHAASCVMSLGLGWACVATSQGGATSPRQPDEQTLVGQAISSLGEHGRFIEGQPELRARLLDYLRSTERLADRARASHLQASPAYQLRLKQAENHILAALYSEQRIAEATQSSALQQYFKTHTAFFVRQEVRVQQLLLRDHEQALSLLARLRKAPEAFRTAVLQHSQGSDAAQGGELAWFRKGVYPLAFESAAFSTPVGSVYPQLLKTTAGFQILKVVGERQAASQSFISLKDEVRAFCLRLVKERIQREAAGEEASGSRLALP